jgi:DNA-binding SARP family transcriptional activator
VREGVVRAGDVRTNDADPVVTIQLLGPVQLLVDGLPVPVGGPGVRGLLALLTLNADRIVPLDEIIDLLWGHEPPATARTIVHGNVSQLRRVFRSVQGHGDGKVQIRTAPPGYQLTVAAEQVDVNRARALLEQAALAPPERRAAMLREALGLWRGPALAGVPRWVTAPELEELRAAVHGARVDADLELGRHAELIAELAPMVRENPHAERTVEQLMLALYRSGRRADALETYRRVSRSVIDTQGIEPGPQLRALHDRMLRDELDPLAEAAAEPFVPAQLPRAVPFLAGRDAELAWLSGLRQRAQQGRCPVAVVTGTAGVGKSALVTSWAHDAAAGFAGGVLHASLRGFDPEHEPLAPAEVLAQFLQGLGVAAGDIPEQLHERVALYRSLLAGRNVLVLLDDARSAEQVRPLLPPARHAMTVVTSRARLDGLAVTHAAQGRALGTLSEGDAVRLIVELTGDDAAEEGRIEQVARLCGYLPLALRIAGARLASSPEWTREELVGELADERSRLAALDDGTSDTSVRAALDVSYRGLAEDLARTFRLLGVLTVPSVGPHMVAAVCGTEVAEARQRLRKLSGHNLLTEVARDTFQAHDLVRLYARELAEAELDAGAHAQLLQASLRYYRGVADRARRRLLRIVDPLDFTGDVPVHGAPRLDGFDDAVAWFVAEWPNLLHTVDRARAMGLHDDAWRLARVVHTYCVVRPSFDDWHRLVEAGLAAAEAADNDLGRCWMLISRCAVALTFGQSEGCLADAEAALEIATKLGDDRLVISANIHVGSTLSQAGRYAEAIERQLEAIEVTGRLGDLALRGQALNNCAEAEKLAGRYPEAIAHQTASLEIDRRLGDDSYAVVSLNNLAELCLATGELAEAERYAHEAIELTAARGLTLQEGVSRLTLSRILRATGDRAGARAQLRASVELHERVRSQLAEQVRDELRELERADA